MSLADSVEGWARAHPEVQCNLEAWEDMEEMVSRASECAADAERNRIEKCFHDRAVAEGAECPVMQLRKAYWPNRKAYFGCLECHHAKIRAEVADVPRAESPRVTDPNIRWTACP